MTAIRMTRKELRDLVNQIDDAGGDSSQLRTVLDSLEDQPVSSPENADEIFIEEMLKASPLQEGTDLDCCLCHRKVNQLYSGVCQDCFRPWALSTKKGKKDRG